MPATSGANGPSRATAPGAACLGAFYSCVKGRTIAYPSRIAFGRGMRPGVVVEGGASAGFGRNQAIVKAAVSGAADGLEVEQLAGGAAASVGGVGAIGQVEGGTQGVFDGRVVE